MLGKFRLSNLIFILTSYDVKTNADRYNIESKSKRLENALKSSTRQTQPSDLGDAPSQRADSDDNGSKPLSHM